MNLFVLILMLVPCFSQNIPFISHITQNQTKDIGSTVELECSIKNVNNYPVLWTVLATDQSATPKFLSTGTSLVTKDSRFGLRYDPASSKYVLQIKDIRETDAGMYFCNIVVSLMMNFIKSGVELSVRTPPVITINSTHWIVVSEGNSVQMECYASGNPQPTIMWHRKNSAILPTGI